MASADICTSCARKPCTDLPDPQRLGCVRVLSNRFAAPAACPLLVRDSAGLNKLLFGLDGWALRRLASDANAAAGLPMWTAPAFPTETAPFLARLLDGRRIYLLGVLPGQEIPAHLVRSPAKPAPKKEVVEQIVEQVEAAPPPKKEEKKVRTPVHIIEVPDVLFALGSAVPALDEEGWLVGAIATAVLYAKDEGAARQERLIVCGHADTTGEPPRNYEIAEQRAQMVKAILEQNAEGWKTLANRHGRVRDYQRTLKSLANAYGWSCDPGEVDNRNGPKTEAAVKAFQAECNERYGMDLKADGIVGPKTWTAIHRTLCALVCEHLDIAETVTPAPPKWLKPVYGFPAGQGVYSCGESFPVDAVGRDDVASEENRRVELVFAPKDLEVKAAPSKSVNMTEKDCVLYDGGRVERQMVAVATALSAYKLSSQFGLSQAKKLAVQLSEINFMAIMVKMFGTDIPFDAYSMFYNDLRENKVENIAIEIHEEDVEGHPIAYNSKRNLVHLQISMLQGAIDDPGKRPELLAALTEEFGHHIDFLLRNQYSQVGGDAKNDEGAVFAFKIFDVNILEQETIVVGEVVSPNYSGSLAIDLKDAQAELKKYVDEQAQLDDGKSADEDYEFFNAGELKLGYGHENIDKKLEDVGYDYRKDLPHVFLGNWLRDFSQIVCGTITRISKPAHERLKKDLGRLADPKEKQRKYDNAMKYNSVKISREALTQLVGLLAAKEFVMDKQKERWNEYNANECMATFARHYRVITPDVLGCYRPEEHIDNPKGLADESYLNDLASPKDGNDKSLDVGFFVGCRTDQLNLDVNNGQKRYIKESFAERPSPVKYIKSKLHSAVQKGKNKTGLCDLGAALHVLEDYFAHTNFVEICLVKLVDDQVYTWVENIDGKGFCPHDLTGDALKDSRHKMAAPPYKSKKATINARASCIPVVSGVFGKIDTFATLCSKIRALFEYPDFEYVPPKPGQRSFADLAIVATLESLAEGQREQDAKIGSGENDYADMLLSYKNFLQWRDWKANKIQKGGVVGTGLEWIDLVSSYAGKIMQIPGVLFNQVILSYMESAVKESETYAYDFGTDPTHTQLNKDDPAHPINDLAGKLGVIAAQRVGSILIDIWDKKATLADVDRAVDDIMSHPCHTDWMDDFVMEWAGKHPDKVIQLRKASYKSIAKEQGEKLSAYVETEKKKQEICYNKLMHYYEQQHA